MSASGVGDIAQDTAARSLRERMKQHYWDTQRFADEFRRLWAVGNGAFRQRVFADVCGHAFHSVRPVAGQTAERAKAAADWLLLAQAATPDAGVSLGYFPCDGQINGWRPSYPETTGYIITSLLTYAQATGDAQARERAVAMASWEIGVQMGTGAVQGGPVCSPEKQTPAAFNTGMVLDGLCSALAIEPDRDMLEGARRAADWLVADLDAQGYWRTNGAFVSAGEIKTYTCLCAWALYRFGDLVGEDVYRAEAIRAVEAALRQQRANGWFAHNCLTRPDAPLTHTIGYTLQGVLEVGLLARRDDFVDAVRVAADALLPRVASSGYLPGLFDANWRPASRFSCVTGSAQIAIVLYRLFEHTAHEAYRDTADRIVDFLKALQALDSPNPALNGALGGSFPLTGGYMRLGYPNWATKYFLDALLLQGRLAHGSNTPKQGIAP